MPKIKNVLFDIDGTMTDSAPGIIRAYLTVAKKLKVEPPSVEQLRSYIGHPLRKSLSTFVPDPKIEDAVRHYYHCYDHMRIGIMQNCVYDGIHEALGRIQKSGKQLYVVTAKLRDFALPILSRFDLEPFFKGVHAPTSCEATEITDQIRDAIEKEHLKKEQTIMVGDRSFDLMGAQQNGIDFIGVSWGYGGKKELLDAGAEKIADTPAELADLLM